MLGVENSTGAVVLTDGKRRLRIAFVTAAVARITLTEGKKFRTKPGLIVTATSHFSGFILREIDEAFEISTPALKLVVSKRTGAISYFDSTGELLLREPERGGKTLAAKKV